MKIQFLFFAFTICIIPKFISAQIIIGNDTTICEGESAHLMVKMIANGNYCYSWRPDNGTLSCTDCPNPIATPTQSTTYSVIVWGEDFVSKYSDKIKVKVTRGGAYEEDNNQKYGFDDHGKNALEPWKSIKKGDSDKVNFVVSGDAYRSIYFKSSSSGTILLSPSHAESSNQSLTLEGVSSGESEIQANCGGPNGTSFRICHVASYTERTLSLAVRLVNETNYSSTDIDDYIALENYLNSIVFNQAVVYITVTKLPPITIHFDLDNDGHLNVTSPYSLEQQKIIESGDSQGYDKIIFLVDNPMYTDEINRPADVVGIWNIDGRHGFAFLKECENREQAIAHELGHGLGLSHTKDDTYNLMYNSNSDKVKLRKKQWDEINH